MCLQLIILHCRLRGNSLTDTGAIVLARALQQNGSLEELKWAVYWMSYCKNWTIHALCTWKSLAVVGNIYFSHAYSLLFHLFLVKVRLTVSILLSLLAVICKYSLPQSSMEGNVRFWSHYRDWCESEFGNTEVGHYSDHIQAYSLIPRHLPLLFYDCFYSMQKWRGKACLNEWMFPLHMFFVQAERFLLCKCSGLQHLNRNYKKRP